MSNTAFTFENATGGALPRFGGDAHSSGMEREGKGGADAFVREAMQSARSLWALSTVTRLMMAREECLRAVQHNDGEMQRIHELEASLERVARSKLPAKTKSLVRTRVLEQIERLQQRAST